MQDNLIVPRHPPSGRNSGLAKRMRRSGRPPASTRVVASLGPIDLARRCRRELGIGIRDHTALAVTDARGPRPHAAPGRTRVAARYPRRAAQVVDFRTLPPGGDFLVDRA